MLAMMSMMVNIMASMIAISKMPKRGERLMSSMVPVP
jgi:hypothetical protein